jgi:hypothetical protein
MQKGRRLQIMMERLRTQSRRHVVNENLTGAVTWLKSYVIERNFDDNSYEVYDSESDLGFTLREDSWGKITCRFIMVEDHKDLVDLEFTNHLTYKVKDSTCECGYYLEDNDFPYVLYGIPLVESNIGGHLRLLEHLFDLKMIATPEDSEEWEDAHGLMVFKYEIC